MYLKQLSLQNFRNYSKKEFGFDKGTILIVGPNTSGKTNLTEAIFFLATGESFRVEGDEQVIRFGENVGRIMGSVDATQLEAVIANSKNEGRDRVLKKYLVNGVAKRRLDFVGNLLSVLFSPLDLDIIIGAPSKRRQFLDNVISQVDRDYRLALVSYEKGLRQRNALLQRTRETGVRNEKEFVYWDNLLIENGEALTRKREEFIGYLNSCQKDIVDFIVFYDKSVISKDRLLQYKDAEIGAGVTLVGPHRDDFSVSLFDEERRTTHDVKFFGSRGQQRLVVLQLKLLELEFIEKKVSERPILLLDDIFSELDGEHILLILEMLKKQQTFITTTHKEFVPKNFLKETQIIDLAKEK